MMSLKFRFTLLSVSITLLAFIATWSPVTSLLEEVIEEWAVRYAEKQVLFDRQRTLQPIIRELALSRQFAQSSALINFARNPEDPELRSLALKEMENFRYNFLEMNYFVALYKSGEYFHNDANNTYQNRQLRYVLDPLKETDRWFYTLIEQKRNIYVNVNPDAELGVTKLWIDILLTDGNEALGVVGTGLNLSAILAQITHDTDPGVSNIFVDHSGVIQLHRDQSLINFSSLTRGSEKLHNVKQLIDHQDDKALLTQAMRDAFRQKDKVISHYVQSEGKKSLLAVAYLPEIDWYEVTLIDINTLLPLSRFSSILMIYGTALFMMIILLNLAVRTMIINPVNRLNRTLEALSIKPSQASKPETKTEICDLSQHFSLLSQAISQNQSDMQHQLELCQQKLERVRRTDPLTELLNRHGMLSLLEAQHSKTEGTDERYSLIWLDLDNIKEINDRYGHIQGDQALQNAANIMKNHIDEAVIGTSCRWGSDELLAMVNQTHAYQILTVAEAIRLDIERSQSTNIQPDLQVTASIGAYIAREGDSLNDALHHTASALSRAKMEGRNLVRFSHEAGLNQPNTLPQIAPRQADKTS